MATCEAARGRMTREELMRALRLTRDQVRAWEEAGLPAYGIGHARFYYEDEVEAFIRDRPLKRKGGAAG